MSTPTPGVDLSALPADLQAIIAAEVARALKANEPQPPPELTPQERVEAAIAGARAALRGEKPVSAGSAYIHDRLISALEEVASAVFKNGGGA